LINPDQGSCREIVASSSKLLPVETSGARLTTYMDGTAGDAILLLHGGPGVPDYLADVSAILSSKYRVIRFDQRGTGQSTCLSGRYSLQDYVEDLDSVRRAYGLECLGLLGHSWGGIVAQLYATHHPNRVTRLCLCNSSIGLGDDWKLMERAVMAHNRRRGGLLGFILLGMDQGLAMLPSAAGDRAARRMMARVWRNYFDPPSSAPPPSEEWLAGVHSRPIFATRRAALAGDAADLRGLSSAPVLIVFGEHDIYGDTTRRLIARYPSARVSIIPRAGHVPWLQNRPEFVKVIAEFFELQRAA
jgi:proline iminopeptidase